MHMNRGKDTCRHLKAIRRSIAEENGIDMEFPECSYKGSCAGTCPRCEMEARQLENELARRLSIGKLATVAGIALTLAVPAAAVADEQPCATKSLPEYGMAPTRTVEAASACVTDNYSSYAFRILVRDGHSGEPIPFATVRVMEDLTIVAEGVTDTNGIVLISGLQKKKYTIRALAIGYEGIFEHLEYLPQPYLGKPNKIRLTDIDIYSTQSTLGEVIISKSPEDDSLADPLSTGVNQEMEIEGVKVKAQY